MTTDRSISTDGLQVQLFHGEDDGMTDYRGIADATGMCGFLHVELFGEDGLLKQEQHIRNKITDAGDLYLAKMAIALVQPANAAAPTLMTGMKLGTGSTAVAKSGAGAAIVTYVTASTFNKVFDATYPQTNNLGAGLGVAAVYQVTWNAGQATNTTLNEVVIVNDASTDATSTAANTISRALFTSTINKGASDVLKVTWSHLQLGA
jgi:hypothetical protein